jgi:hypothetical protein
MSKEFPYLAEGETVTRSLRHFERELGMDYSVLKLRDGESGSLINGTLLLYIQGDMPYTLKTGRPLRVVQGAGELLMTALDGAEKKELLSADPARTVVPEGETAFIRRLGSGSLVVRLGN